MQAVFRGLKKGRKKNGEKQKLFLPVFSYAGISGIHIRSTPTRSLPAVPGSIHSQDSWSSV